MLSNNGDGDDQDWGLKRFGDQSFRLLIGSRPIAIATKGKAGIPFQLVLAGDVVRNDNLADITKGDLALQGVVALQYITDPFEAGLYGAIRHQTAATINRLGAPTLESSQRNHQGAFHDHQTRIRR